MKTAHRTELFQRHLRSISIFWLHSVRFAESYKKEAVVNISNLYTLAALHLNAPASTTRRMQRRHVGTWSTAYRTHSITHALLQPLNKLNARDMGWLRALRKQCARYSHTCMYGFTYFLNTSCFSFFPWHRELNLICILNSLAMSVTSVVSWRLHFIMKMWSFYPQHIVFLLYRGITGQRLICCVTPWCLSPHLFEFSSMRYASQCSALIFVIRHLSLIHLG